MNGQDLFEALSGLDPKYIDEAAYELRESEKVVDITSSRRRNIRKFLYVALPSVAAILLIVAVALPAVLSVSKSESASMAEAPAAASEAAAPAEDATMADEAPAMAEEAPAMAEEAEPSDESPALDTNAIQTFGPEDNAAKTAEHPEEAMAEAAEAETTTAWQIADSEYKDGKLTLTLSGQVPANLLEMEYYLTAEDQTSKREDILGAPLSDIANEESLKDDKLVLDLSSLELPAGAYVIDIEGTYTRFEVK